MPPKLPKLRPCPFDGVKKVAPARVYTVTGTWYYVGCAECQCEGPYATTPLKACRLWNKRT